MKKLTRLEKAQESVQVLLGGKDFRVSKSFHSCSIVKIINASGGQDLIASFDGIKELEKFLNNLQKLKWHGVIK